MYCIKNLFSGFSFTITLPVIATIVSAGTLSVLLNMIFISWNIKKLTRRYDNYINKKLLDIIKTINQIAGVYKCL